MNTGKFTARGSNGGKGGKNKKSQQHRIGAKNNIDIINLLSGGESNKDDSSDDDIEVIESSKYHANSKKMGSTAIKTSSTNENSSSAAANPPSPRRNQNKRQKRSQSRNLQGHRGASAAEGRLKYGTCVVDVDVSGGLDNMGMIGNNNNNIMGLSSGMLGSTSGMLDSASPLTMIGRSISGPLRAGVAGVAGANGVARRGGMDPNMMMEERKKGGRNGRGGAFSRTTVIDLMGGSDREEGSTTAVQEHAYTVVSSTGTPSLFDWRRTLRALKATGQKRNSKTREYLVECHRKTFDTYMHGPLPKKVTIFECGLDHVSTGGTARFDTVLNGYLSIRLDGLEVFMSDLSGHYAEAAFKEFNAPSSSHDTFARGGNWNGVFDIVRVENATVKKSQFGWVGNADVTKALVQRNLPKSANLTHWTGQLLKRGTTATNKFTEKSFELGGFILDELTTLQHKPERKEDMVPVEQALGRAVDEFMARPGNGEVRTVKVVGGTKEREGFYFKLWNTPTSQKLHVDPSSLKDVVQKEAAVLAQVFSFCQPKSEEKKQFREDKRATTAMIAKLLTVDERKPVAKK